MIHRGKDGVLYDTRNTIFGICGSCGERAELYIKKGYCRRCYYTFYREKDKYTESEIKILAAVSREEKIQEERDNWQFN